MTEAALNTAPEALSPAPQKTPDEAPMMLPVKVLLSSKRMWQARPDVPMEKELLDMRDGLCRQMGITDVPKLFIYESDKPNAACSLIGSNIMFSTDLLKHMTHNQVKAVMGHELTHHTKKAKSWGALTFSIVAVTIATRHAENALERFNPVKPLGKLVKAIGQTRPVRYLAEISGLLAIQGWFQRRYEKEADLGGAKVAGSDQMIGALKVLKVRSDEIKAEEAKEGKLDWKKYTIDLPIFRSHPKSQKRIENIIANGPKNFTGQLEASVASPDATALNR